MCANPKYDEVLVSSNEVLEANVVAIRADLTNFRAAIARIDNDIKFAVARLEAEIRSRAENTESDMKALSARIDRQLEEIWRDMREKRLDIRELRTEDKALRDIADTNYRELSARIETTHGKLSAKIDAL